MMMMLLIFHTCTRRLFSFGGLSQDRVDIRGPLGMHGYHTLFADHVVVMSCHVTSCHVVLSVGLSFASHHTCSV